MPNTRHQNPENRQFRQDAFASSVEFERGVLGNLVAARCQRLSDPDEVAMIWWLQQISWRDGGLERFASEFLAANRSQMATPAMLKLGTEEGRIYTAAQVRAVRADVGYAWMAEFPLKGEVVEADPSDLVGRNDIADRIEARARAGDHPTSYPAKAFLAECSMGDTRFAEILKRALVDPQSESLRAGLWNFSTLWDALCAWRQREIEMARERIVETSIARRVYEELDFARETGSFVVIEGRERIGKTEAARTWCQQNPGRAIYVSLESGNDEATLFRSIARKLGTACSLARKAAEIKVRIEEALQPGHLMLVIDEAHALFPSTERAERSAPKRIDWLRTALIDFDVPVALITTPQRFARACERFRKANWNIAQIQGRVARTTLLPEEPTRKDLLAVAKHYFPSASVAEVLLIAGAAMTTIGFLGTIAYLRKRVSFLAPRQPGVSESALLASALEEILPKSPVPATAAAAVARTPGSRVAVPVPRRCTTPTNLSRISSEQPVLSVT